MPFTVYVIGCEQYPMDGANRIRSAYPSDLSSGSDYCRRFSSGFKSGERSRRGDFTNKRSILRVCTDYRISMSLSMCSAEGIIKSR